MKFLFLIGIVWCLAGCKRSKECPDFWGYQLPASLFFKLESNGQRLPDSVLNNLKLFYMKGSAREYVRDFKRSLNDQPPVNTYQLGLMVTREAALKSGNDKIKDYYLEFPDGDIDTLYVDYRRLTTCEADTSRCYCLYPRQRIMYNGRDAFIDPADPFKTAFLFVKQ